MVMMRKREAPPPSSNNARRHRKIHGKPGEQRRRSDPADQLEEVPALGFALHFLAVDGVVRDLRADQRHGQSGHARDHVGGTVAGHEHHEHGGDDTGGAGEPQGRDRGTPQAADEEVDRPEEEREEVAADLDALEKGNLLECGLVGGRTRRAMRIKEFEAIDPAFGQAVVGRGSRFGLHQLPH
ncbi:hypothetical protein PT2222_270094 [Paraburkholderia tropica]